MKAKKLWVMLVVALAFPHSLFSQTSPKNNEITFHRYVFGINFIPYYSDDMYQIDWNYRTQYLRSSPRHFIELQGSVGYFILRRLSASFTVGYDGFDQDQTFDWYKNYLPYVSSGQNEHWGYDNTSYVKRLLLRVDVRYFLRNRSIRRVAPFVQVGLGKYIASANHDREERPLSDQENVKRENNNKDFLSDFNSPYVYDVGFGAEYYFNSSLALNASVVLITTYRKGTLKYREAADDYTAWSKNVYERTDWQTQIGVGLSFFF